MERQLTDKQRAFLSCLGGEAKGDIRTAMKMAGYADNTSVTEVINSLTDEIIEIGKKLLAGNAVKATFKMVDVLDNPSALGNDRLIAAAKEILDRAGLVKKEQQEQIIKADNIYILPPKDA